MGRSLVGCVFVIGSACAAYASEDMAPRENRGYVGATQEFTDAAGRPIGSVTRIGDVTYYAATDGKPLGVARIVNGRKVFKAY